MNPQDLAFIDATLKELGSSREAVIPILQKFQEHWRWLPPEALEELCRRSEITPAQVASVSTFYTQFRHTPIGEHVICVCRGTACHVKGAELVQDAFARHLNIPEGSDTSPDKLFTIEEVACLGCCTLAPVVKIDEAVYGHLTATMIPQVINDFLSRSDTDDGGSASQLAVPPEELAEIRIGLGSCCVAGGSADVMHSLEKIIEKKKIPARVKRVGCVGMCHRAPLVEILPPKVQGRNKVWSKKLFGNVAEELTSDILLDKVGSLSTATNALHSIGQTFRQLATGSHTAMQEQLLADNAACRDDVAAFLAPQQHIATKFCGEIDPTDLDEYIARGGFEAYQKIQDLPNEELIETIIASGLRGRGGAGFPTGRKWQAITQHDADQKYLVVNGDEGDPGAFMDRMLLESFPYRVIEGAAIAAKAVGATKGYFYIRAEYPLAVKRIRESLELLYEKNILRDVHFRVKEGAGAFVCGEETALLASIEGKRGMPRIRPPFPVESGLWGKPTLVSNVETFSLVPWIFRNGADKFAAIGTESSRGTKVFALAGKIRRGGLIEVPMGMTLREIVEKIGGGVENDKEFKGVQVGGPSGGCVPAAQCDVPVDYEELQRVGAIMGSGGLVVLDEDDCMVEIARYFLEFTQQQSCGKCTFCRIGTKRMLEILEKLCAGTARKAELEELETLANQVKDASLCGLGGTAPNPVLSTLASFRDEYLAHLEGTCPAGRCANLSHYVIGEGCNGCTRCAQVCPAGAIRSVAYELHVIDDELCTRCDACRSLCHWITREPKEKN